MKTLVVYTLQTLSSLSLLLHIFKEEMLHEKDGKKGE